MSNLIHVWSLEPLNFLPIYHIPLDDIFGPLLSLLTCLCFLLFYWIHKTTAHELCHHTSHLLLPISGCVWWTRLYNGIAWKRWSRMISNQCWATTCDSQQMTLILTSLRRCKSLNRHVLSWLPLPPTNLQMYPNCTTSSLFMLSQEKRCPFSWKRVIFPF